MIQRKSEFGRERERKEKRVKERERERKIRERERPSQGVLWMDGWTEDWFALTLTPPAAKKIELMNEGIFHLSQMLCLFPVKTRFLWYLERFQARLVKSEFEF